MKIICDNCRTKYSIADEKVKGKVFKIRCKKCSNIIVVRGNQPQDGSADPAEAGEDYAGGAGAGEEYGDAPTWHLVIDQKQVGPMTGAEVRDRYAQGEIDADSYIWREGFTDWMRIAQVEDFADIAQSTMVADAAQAQAPAEQPQSWGAEAPSQEEQWGGEAAQPAWNAGAPAAATPSGWSAGGADTSRTDSDGLFGAAAPAAEDPGRDLFGTGEAGGGEAPADGGGLFGSAGAMAGDAGAAAEPAGDLFGGGGGGGGGGHQLFPQEEEPQPAVQMTGARNENSVLFSLSNLQALAMGPGGGGGGGGGGASPVVAKAASGPADGSGLIDIRSMAVGGPKPAAPSSDDGLPDLGGFAAPIAAAPVLIPAGSDERPAWLLPTIIGGSVILVGAIVTLVLVLVMRKPEPVYVAQANPGADQTQKADPATKADPAKVDEKKTETPTATEEPKKDEPGAEAKATTPTKRRHGRRRAGHGGGGGGGRKHEPAAARSSDDILGGGSSKSKSNRKRDALDDLIDGAVGSKKASRPKPSRSSAAAASSDSNLPETLSRAQIQGGMRGIKGKVQGCYDRYKVPGMANVQVKIGRNGRVNSARVVGMFAGTPTGACVQAASRSASFPRFKGAPITITYPFILR